MYLYLHNIFNIKKKDIYNIDKKSNILRFISSIKVIINMKNKSSFYFITTNKEWVLIIEVIFKNKKKV